MWPGKISVVEEVAWEASAVERVAQEIPAV